MARRNAEDWEEILSKQAKSGESQEKWCEREGINYRTFKDRYYKQRRLTQEIETDSIKWQKAYFENVNKAESAPSVIYIEAGKFRITALPGTPEEDLTSVLRAVSKLC